MPGVLVALAAGLLLLLVGSVLQNEGLGLQVSCLLTCVQRHKEQGCSLAEPGNLWEQGEVSAQCAECM